MTPDAPDVAEMVAWCDNLAALFKDAAGQCSTPESVREAYADHDMLRAIAERLRARGGDHDAG